MKLFEFDMHIGDWRVLVQTNDIQNGAIQSRHITNNAVTTVKIGDGEVKSRNIATDAVTTDKIGNGEVKTRNIGKEAVTNEKIADNAITGDEIEGNTVKNGKLSNDAVQTRNIKNRNVTADKLALALIHPEHLNPAVIQYITQDLQNQIDSLQIHGLAVSNEFGSAPHIGISQKTLTEAVNKLWAKIEDITGEVLQGFNMVITPEYYIGETGADVHISANTVEANGIFEHIAFYANGQLIAEASNADYFEYDFHIDETTVIQCVAKIMGVEYNRQGIITHYSSFLLGSGDTYADLMDGNSRFLPQYVIPITNGMRGAYDVDVAEGKRIIVVVGDSLSEGFIRADLNGVEIQFTESTCTDADGKTYKVFTSEPWSAGDYNIDING